MNSHHLILGKTTDFITGEEIEDNHDERYRQDIAKLLINKKKYQKKEIIKNKRIEIPDNQPLASIPVDYTVYINGRPLMIIKYGPGSLVTREKPAIACSRLIYKDEIPICIVTNGEDAEIIDVATGSVIRRGLDSIPTRDELIKITRTIQPKKIDTNIKDKAEKILFAFEVDGRCPCDDTICLTREKNNG